MAANLGEASPKMGDGTGCRGLRCKSRSAAPVHIVQMDTSSLRTHTPRIAHNRTLRFPPIQVFLYCWGGMGASAAFFTTAAAKEEGFGSLMQVGWSYMFA